MTFQSTSLELKVALSVKAGGLGGLRKSWEERNQVITNESTTFRRDVSQDEDHVMNSREICKIVKLGHAERAGSVGSSAGFHRPIKLA